MSIHANEYSLINSIKTTLACFIALLLTKFIGLQQPQWVLISIILVMSSQYRLGGAIMKGYYRMLATAVGASLAAIILFLFSYHYILVYTLLFSSIAVLIYFAGSSKEYAYAYTLGAATMVIIVVTDNPQLHHAIDRLVEILLGVIIALLVSRFILPIRAEVMLAKNLSTTLTKLRETYQLFIHQEKTFTVEPQQQNLEEEIIKNFTAQPVLLKEACMESKDVRRNRIKYTILLRLERRLLRSIYMLHLTLRVSLKNFGNIITMPEFKVLHAQVIMMMNDMAAKFLDKNYKLHDFELTPTYEEIIKKIRTVFDQYSFEEKNKIHSFIFCLGHVILVLNRMNVKMRELYGSN